MSAYTPAALRTQQLMAIVSSVEPAAWARVAARAGAPADQNEYQEALVDLWHRAEQADRASAESTLTAVFGNGFDSPEEINSELVRHEETVNRALNELSKSNTIPDAAGATRAAITGQEGFAAFNSPLVQGVKTGGAALEKYAGNPMLGFRAFLFGDPQYGTGGVFGDNGAPNMKITIPLVAIAVIAIAIVVGRRR